MHEVTTLAEIEEVASDCLALVPTMGALHRGHQSLITKARTLSDEVMVSVFVNPLQFENSEDLITYPSTPVIDSALAEESGATILWRPRSGDLFEDNYRKIAAGVLGEVFEGAHRTQHFSGVLTVVSALFNATKPRWAIFGEKDFQQLFLIKRMCSQLHPEVEIISAPTVRDSDGLAISSRNVRLSGKDREAALVISRSLKAVTKLSNIEMARAELEKNLASEPALTLDYAEIIDEETFTSALVSTRNKRVIIAGWINGVRLLDNMAMGSNPAQSIASIAKSASR